MEEKNIVVGVTSKNTLKVETVRSEFEKYFPESKIEIISFSCKSLVPEQPITTKIGYLGAENRLNDLKNQNNMNPSKSKFDFFVSFESTIEIRENKKCFDICCIIVENGLTKQVFKDTGPDSEIPYKYVEQSLTSNFEITAGKFVEKENPNIPNNNWMPFFGGMDRKESMRIGLSKVLKKMSN